MCGQQPGEVLRLQRCLQVLWGAWQWGLGPGTGAGTLLLTPALASCVAGAWLRMRGTSPLSSTRLSLTTQMVLMGAGARARPDLGGLFPIPAQSRHQVLLGLGAKQQQERLSLEVSGPWGSRSPKSLMVRTDLGPHIWMHRAHASLYGHRVQVHIPPKWQTLSLTQGPGIPRCGETRVSVWCQGVGWGDRGLSPGASVHSSFWSLVPSRSMPGAGQACSSTSAKRQGTPQFLLRSHLSGFLLGKRAQDLCALGPLSPRGPVGVQGPSYAPCPSPSCAPSSRESFPLKTGGCFPPTPPVCTFCKPCYTQALNPTHSRPSLSRCLLTLLCTETQCRKSIACPKGGGGGGWRESKTCRENIFQSSDLPACESHCSCTPAVPAELRRAPGPAATAPLPCQPPPRARGSSRVAGRSVCRCLRACLVLAPCPLSSGRPSQIHLQ